MQCTAQLPCSFAPQPAAPTPCRLASAVLSSCVLVQPPGPEHAVRRPAVPTADRLTSAKLVSPIRRVNREPGATVVTTKSAVVQLLYSLANGISPRVDRPPFSSNSLSLSRQPSSTSAFCLSEMQESNYSWKRHELRCSMM